MLLEFADVVPYLALGQEEISPFEPRLLDEEHEQENGVHGI